MSGSSPFALEPEEVPEELGDMDAGLEHVRVLEEIPEELDALEDRPSRNKPGIVMLLRPEDWRVFFDERAGIAESDGGLPRPKAEACAFACCVVEWMNRNFVPSPLGRCAACGSADHACDPLLPHGVEPTGYAWLHSRCWPAWHTLRKAEAVAALDVMGITPPAEFPDDPPRS